MDEIMNTDRRDTEIAALNHEIYELTKQLNDRDRQILELNTTDRSDPFGNPTDYKEYSGDYSKILPELGAAGYKMPLDPEYSERKGLRRYYSVGGWCIILHFVLSLLVGTLLIRGIVIIARMLNPDADSGALSDYLTGSSIVVAVNALVYIFCNIGLAFLGMKWAGFKPRSMIRTKDMSFGRVVQYCLIGMLIWIVSIYSSNIIVDIFDKFGIDLLTHSGDVGSSFLGRVIELIYSCLLAPVTEEIFYRGMVLKCFARADQRFAIFASAIFFGIAHGNVSQFILGFLAGIFLAHITIKHNSIIPAIVVHMFINTISTLFSEFAHTDSISALIAMLVLYASAILGIVMLMVFISGDRMPYPTPHQRSRGLIVALGSVAFSGAFIIDFMYMVLKIVRNSR